MDRTSLMADSLRDCSQWQSRLNYSTQWVTEGAYEKEGSNAKIYHEITFSYLSQTNLNRNRCVVASCFMAETLCYVNIHFDVTLKMSITLFDCIQIDSGVLTFIILLFIICFMRFIQDFPHCPLGNICFGLWVHAWHRCDSKTVWSLYILQYISFLTNYWGHGYTRK